MKKKSVTAAKSARASKTGPKRPAGRARPERPKPARRSRSAARAPSAPAEPLPALPVEPAADTAILVETPEPHFASRISPPEPERPQPTGRRAIFYDVENASRPEHIAKVLDHLEVDRTGHRTDFVAVGNWRVIGHDTARLLARHGAHLVHSAPSVGVRDWSDLRIAVSAGVWMAGARPGDAIEIVTSDRAFDAVGDVAASLGISFRRLSHQVVTGAPAEPRAPAREVTAEPRSRRRGRGRRHGGWRPRSTSGPAAPAPVAEPREVPSPPAPPPAAPAMEAPAEAPPHTAPHDEIIAVVHDLLQRSTGRPVTLDTLANALKSRGFSRPPGSPRLITRLRRIKEISLSRSGVITLVGDQHPGAHRAAEPEPPAEMPEPEVAAAPVAVEASDAEEGDEGPQPGNEAVPTSTRSDERQGRRRRSRRGGRGRYHRPQPAPAA